MYGVSTAFLNHQPVFPFPLLRHGQDRHPSVNPAHLDQQHQQNEQPGQQPHHPPRIPSGAEPASGMIATDSVTASKAQRVSIKPTSRTERLPNHSNAIPIAMSNIAT